jgi:hypothetical protein
VKHLDNHGNASFHILKDPNHLDNDINSVLLPRHAILVGQKLKGQEVETELKSEPI